MPLLRQVCSVRLLICIRAKISCLSSQESSFCSRGTFNCPCGFSFFMIHSLDDDPSPYCPFGKRDTANNGVGFLPLSLDGFHRWIFILDLLDTAEQICAGYSNDFPSLKSDCEIFFYIIVLMTENQFDKSNIIPKIFFPVSLKTVIFFLVRSFLLKWYFRKIE